MEKLLFELPVADQEFTKADFGGKAFSLNFLLKKGIPVPKTVVIKTSAHKIFLESNNFIPFHIIAQSVYENDESIDSLKNIMKDESLKYVNARIPEILNTQINNFIAKTKNDLFAIRSSANCEDGVDRAWAGQFNSFLNTQKSEIKKCIKSCFASVFSPGVFYYALRNSQIGKPIDMAVILQEMIPAEISGVCFTTNPISGNENEIMIEFCEGLGVPLVSSQIVPHMYIVNKNNSTISEYRCGTQKRVMRYGEMNDTSDVITPLQVKCRELSQNQIKNILKMAIILENIFGTAQDFEWTLVGDELTVIQSRNITT